MQSPPLSAAMQDRLAAGSVTLQLHLWIFAVHTGVQYPNTSALNTVEGKMQSPQLSAALQDRLAAGSVTLQSHLWTFAVHTGVQ